MAESRSESPANCEESELSDDERTTAVGLFHDAHSYWASTSALEFAELRVTHPDAPVNLLYFHSIELFLKAFLREKGMPISEIRDLGHNATRLAKQAEERGLELAQQDWGVIELVKPNYLPSRYIQIGQFTRASYSSLWATCSWLFDLIGEELVRAGRLKRLPKRPSHSDDCGND